MNASPAVSVPLIETASAALESQIPAFTATGFLPPGIHPASWDAFCARYGWNAKRIELLKGMHHAIRMLLENDVVDLYVGGSFVTTKDQPDDFDIAYVLPYISSSSLRQKYPVLLWGPGQKMLFGGQLDADFDAPGESLKFFRHSRCGQDIGVVKLDLSTVPQLEPSVEFEILDMEVRHLAIRAFRGF